MTPYHGGSHIFYLNDISCRVGRLGMISYEIWMAQALKFWNRKVIWSLISLGMRFLSTLIFQLIHVNKGASASNLLISTMYYHKDSRKVGGALVQYVSFELQALGNLGAFSTACGCASQILERYDDISTQSRQFEKSRRLFVRCLTA